jgi:hypothetical protein
MNGDSYARDVELTALTSAADFRGLADNERPVIERRTALDLGFCVEVSGLEPPTSTLRT